MCVCVNMSLSAAEWKGEHWNTALVCCHLGCPYFHSLFCHCSYFFAQIVKNLIISGQKKKQMTSQTSVSVEGGIKLIPTDHGADTPGFISLGWNSFVDKE